MRARKKEDIKINCAEEAQRVNLKHLLFPFLISTAVFLHLFPHFQHPCGLEVIKYHISHPYFRFRWRWEKWHVETFQKRLFFSTVVSNLHLGCPTTSPLTSQFPQLERFWVKFPRKIFHYKRQANWFFRNSERRNLCRLWWNKNLVR